MALEDPFEPVERQVIGVFAGQDVGQQPRTRQTLLDRLDRQRTDHHVALALRAGVLDACVLEHAEARRNVLELLADLFTDPLERHLAFPADAGLRRRVVFRAVHSDESGHPFRRKPATPSERSDEQGSWLVEVAAFDTSAAADSVILLSPLDGSRRRGCGSLRESWAGGGRAPRISEGCGKVRGRVGGGPELSIPRQLP